jgi:hypothetical protein
VLPNSREHLRLREIEGVDYAYQHESGCQWLDEPKPAPAPPQIHVAEPAIHSGIAGVRSAYAGAAMVGTARATVPAR